MAVLIQILTHQIRLKAMALKTIILNPANNQNDNKNALHISEKTAIGINILWAFKKACNTWLVCKRKNIAVKKNIHKGLLSPPGKICMAKFKYPEKDKTITRQIPAKNVNKREVNKSLPESIRLLAIKKIITEGTLNPNKSVAKTMLLKKIEYPPYAEAPN